LASSVSSRTSAPICGALLVGLGTMTTGPREREREAMLPIPPRPEESWGEWISDNSSIAHGRRGRLTGSVLAAAMMISCMGLDVSLDGERMLPAPPRPVE